LTSKDRPAEWEAFRKRFLPNWRGEMLEELMRTSAVAESLDSFVRNGRYIFLRPESAGDRSFVNFSPGQRYSIRLE